MRYYSNHYVDDCLLTVFLSCAQTFSFIVSKDELLLSSQEIPEGESVVEKREFKKDDKAERCGIHWIYAPETPESRQICSISPVVGLSCITKVNCHPGYTWDVCVLPGWNWEAILWSSCEGRAASIVWTKCHTASRSRDGKVHRTEKCSLINHHVEQSLSYMKSNNLWREKFCTDRLKK